MLYTESAKLTGTPDASGWSQVHEFKPDDPQKVLVRGSLFAAIATKRVEAGGLDTIEAGRELIARLHEEYYGDLSLKPFNALKSAVEKVVAEFKESWGDVEIAACSLADGVVYSAAAGGGEVTICRDGSLGTILKSSEAVVVASGYPKGGDVILLGTKNFYQRMPLGIIKAALTSESPDSAIEVFGPGVHGEEGAGSLAAIVIKFVQNSFVENTETPETGVEEAPLSAMSLNKPLVKAKVLASGILTKILSVIPRKPIYVKPQFDEETMVQGKKLTFSAGVILLLVLMASIGFGIRQKKINEIKSQYQTILVSAEKDVDEAVSLASVSPEKSRELFIQSVQKLNQILEMEVKDPKVDSLKKKIEDSKAAILGEFAVSPELFLDLSLLSSGFKGDAVSVSGGSVFILDKNGKRVVSVELSSKKSKVVAGPGVIDEALEIASYEDRVFVLGGDGVYEIGSTKSKVLEKTWAGDAFIKAFAGNLYVLDKSGNAVYRYAGNGNSFGEKQDWLATGTRVDFSDAKDWMIDGSVYVLFPSSKVSKFSLGSPKNFTLGGIVPEIGNVDAIFAGDENEGIYLLDRAGKRVVVTDKDGKYISQYTSDQIANVTSIVVSENDKKIILLAGDKLFSIEIKHL